MPQANIPIPAGAEIDHYPLPIPEGATIAIHDDSIKLPIPPGLQGPPEPEVNGARDSAPVTIAIPDGAVIE